MDNNIDSRANFIQSPDNPVIILAHACHERKGREEHGLFLVEGQRAVSDFLAAGWIPAQLFSPIHHDVPDTWIQAVAPLQVLRVTAKALRKLSTHTTPSGWAGLFSLPQDRPIATTNGVVLVGLQDPGNVGTLIRAAAAFAWPQVVLVGGADPFSGKVVQASAGALARVAVRRVAADCPPAEIITGPAAALVVDGGCDPETVTAPLSWLVIGGEAEGLSADWIAACTQRVTLPMPGGTESLNAAVAGAIAAYVLRHNKPAVI